MDEYIMNTIREMLMPLTASLAESDVLRLAHLAAFFLFGLTGGIMAVKRNYDFFGLFTMAFATAAGGGLIRDGLFIQDGPALITQKSSYIVVILLSALFSVFFRHRVVRFDKLIAWIDAYCIGIYGIVGVQKSLAAGLSNASAIVVGVISASGGGLLRDLLAGDEPLMLKPGQFYMLAILAGCCVYLGCLHVDIATEHAVYAGVGVTFVVRILAILFNWTTSPVSRWSRSE